MINNKNRIGLFLFLIGIAAISIWFISLLLKSSAEIQVQSIANLLGAAIGTVGAYIVAKWAYESGQRERYRLMSEIAQATFNAIIDRLHYLDAIAEILPLYDGSKQALWSLRDKVVEIHFTPKPISSTLRAQLSTYYPYVDNELDDLDRAILAWISSLGHAYFNSRGRGQSEKYIGELISAGEHLQMAVDSRKGILRLFRKPFLLSGNGNYWDPDFTDADAGIAAVEAFRAQLPKDDGV
ncbi:MAG: hypothetical protein EWV63_14000 [Microcystis aeruginosa Ma_OC_H_19870700_S124]|uniref:DUF4760 domain-containing protein n=1 Tax=Microcystis aeruginosa Ma_OC_H_19870700_S124 TaxID=2486262 RepID=A0A552AHX7_MICAE|nr:MAG: hypothetical protein EWV63_14000 [Microcystis aeruginosa Ma_OC_H_19870700_S124]